MTRFYFCLILLALFGALSMPASAKSSFLRDFKVMYPDNKLSTSVLSCALCHTDVKKKASNLTLYGQSFKSAKGATRPEKFKAIESLDSDKDGFSNLEEIKAGTNPSDPADKPKGKPGMQPVKASDEKTSATATPAAKAKKKRTPKAKTAAPAAQK